MFWQVTVMNTKTLPEGALNVSPDEMVYELFFSVEETATSLSDPIAHIFAPMANS
jgi:hypothetical protein